MPDPVRVLVTAIGGGGHGEQVLKALKLAETPYTIVGADARPDWFQFDWVDEQLTLPLASDPGYIDAVIEACRRHAIAAVFHGSEPELRRLSAARDRFAAEGVFLPINPADVIDLCMDKERTNARLAELGFPPPRFVRARNRAALAGIDWFPVIVKPSTGGGGSANCYIAQDYAELEALASYLGIGEQADHFLVQEYVGTPDDEYTVGVLHDLDGEFINSIAVRRLLSGKMNIQQSVRNRTDRADLGSSLVISSGVSHGPVGRFPEVTGPCEEMARALGARGSMNFQCRLVDGEVRVFEINARYSGTTSIRALVGYNEPDILIRRHVLGEKIAPRFPYEERTVLRGISEYVLPSSTSGRDRGAS